MSHTVTIKTQFLDEKAIAATCKEMGLPAPEMGEHSLYANSGQRIKGIAVKLPNWNYPLVIDPKTGQASYDNYGGAWGDQSHLNRFTQLYAVNKATLEAKKKGHMVLRTMQPNGSIRLSITGRSL